MSNSKMFILLVGDKTKFQDTYVRWEIEQALKMGLPIIAVNLDGKRHMDENRCPLILRDKLAIHVPFSQAMIAYALEHWPASDVPCKAQGKTGPTQ